MFLRRRIFFAKIKKLVQAFVKLKKKCIFAPNMRFFTFILSLYLLALTGLPCTDMLEGEESSASYEFVTAPTGEHSHFHLDSCIDLIEYLEVLDFSFFLAKSTNHTHPLYLLARLLN